MKYKQILIIISIVLIGIQRNVYSQNSNNIKSINIQSDTLYDLERRYKLPPNGFDININLDSLEFTERRISKVRRIQTSKCKTLSSLSVLKYSDL